MTDCEVRMCVFQCRESLLENLKLSEVKNDF